MTKGTFTWNNSGPVFKPYSQQKSFFLSECKSILLSSLSKTLSRRIIGRWCFVWWGDKSHHRVGEMFCQQEMENYSTNGCRVSDKIFLSDPSPIIAVPCHSVTKCWDLTCWICYDCYMDFSKLILRFVKVVTCIFLALCQTKLIWSLTKISKIVEASAMD